MNVRTFFLDRNLCMNRQNGCYWRKYTTKQVRNCEDRLLKIDVNCRPTDTCYVYGQDDDQWEILPSLPNPLCGKNKICIYYLIMHQKNYNST